MYRASSRLLLRETGMMVGLNGLLSALVKPQRKADRDVNKSDSRERQIARKRCAENVPAQRSAQPD